MTDSNDFSIAHCTGEHKTDILRRVVTGHSESSLARYIDDGGKYCLLASAGRSAIQPSKGEVLFGPVQGSVYLLAILAAAGQKTKIRCIASDMMLRLHHAIRRPVRGAL